MAGLPGSGKSTVALAVGRRLRWPVLDKDTVKSTLLKLGADEDLAARASYIVLDELARDLVVKQGLCAIIDSPSSYLEAIEAAQRIADDAGGVLKVVLCEASPRERSRRLKTRPRKASHVTEVDRPEELVIEQRFLNLPPDTIRVCTEDPAEDLIEHILTEVLAGRSSVLQPL